MTSLHDKTESKSTPSNSKPRAAVIASSNSSSNKSHVVPTTTTSAVTVVGLDQTEIDPSWRWTEGGGGDDEEETADRPSFLDRFLFGLERQRRSCRQENTSSSSSSGGIIVNDNNNNNEDVDGRSSSSRDRLLRHDSGNNENGNRGFNNRNNKYSYSSCCSRIQNLLLSSCSLLPPNIRLVLIRSSPENASLLWMILNLLCLVSSIYVGIEIWNLDHSSGDDDGDAEGNDDATDDNGGGKTTPYQRLATADYLVWSCFMTIVWSVEATLRALYPRPKDEEDTRRDHNHNHGEGGGEIHVDQYVPAPEEGSTTTTIQFGSVSAIEASTPPITTSYDRPPAYQNQQGFVPSSRNDLNDIISNNSIDSTELGSLDHVNTNHNISSLATYVPRQRTTQEKISLGIELILAAWFTIESIYDTIQWKTSIRVENAMLSQEFDVWLSVVGYVYMTYETYHSWTTKIRHQQHNQAGDNVEDVAMGPVRTTTRLQQQKQQKQRLDQIV